MGNGESSRKQKAYEACPHCGHKLSRWEQVLLNVDKALMCKSCWYRIILDVRDESPERTDQDEQPPVEKR
jgi:DNA-directed RNA polymerase subunit RPC12/RpoP